MEQDLSEIINKLNLGLVYCSIGYIPQSFINLINKKDGELLQGMVNKIIIIDKKGFDKQPTTTELFMLIGKPSMLSQNIFYLNNLKQEHNKDNFNYILDKYLGYLNGAIHITEYYSNNIEIDIPEAENNVKASFKNQYNYLIKHKEEFNSKFMRYNFSKPDLNSWLNQNTLNNLNDTFSNSKIPQLKVEDFIRKQQTLNTNTNTNTKEVKKSKAQLKKENLQAIKDKTNQEAEQYILKTVFNIDV